MRRAVHQEQPAAGAYRDQIPTELAALALPSDHIAALRVKVSVAAEFRGKRGPFYKLRYRSEGRQVVHYLGKDPEAAERVRLAVFELQAEHHLAQQLQRVTIQAREILRATKLALRRELRAAGFDFHGLEIRRTLRYGPRERDAASDGGDAGSVEVGRRCGPSQRPNV